MINLQVSYDGSRLCYFSLSDNIDGRMSGMPVPTDQIPEVLSMIVDHFKYKEEVISIDCVREGKPIKSSLVVDDLVKDLLMPWNI